MCFLVGFFAYVFALLFGGSLPKVSEKMLLMSDLLCFGVLSLFLWFFSSTPFFAVFFKRQRSGSHRTPLHTHLCCWFLFFLCPAALVCFARFGRASRFLVVFSGCHSGPRAFLGFSLNLRGLSSLAPSEALFLGREAARVFSVLLLPCFSFSPFVLRLHFF